MRPSIPTVTKNILIINVILFILCGLVPTIEPYLMGFYFQSEFFRPWQIVTHMFMHGNLPHIFFNMFAVYMFGAVLENQWGPKKFLNYYLLCGLGAFGLHELISYIEVSRLAATLPADSVQKVMAAYVTVSGPGIEVTGLNALSNMVHLNSVVGASGCVFGLLIAYGMLYPNTELMLMFFPVPIKAKWFVLGYGAVELVNALRNAPDDNVAHYAHLGGMIFGFIILKIWQKKGKLYS